MKGWFSPGSVDGTLISSFSLGQDCAPVASLETLHWIDQWAFAFDGALERRSEPVDGGLDEEPGLANFLVSC